jgi:4'-phosphopantetheinyl transferase
VGVDVEAVDPDFPVALVGRRFLSEAERGYVLDGEVGSRGGRFARCWCRKEAVAKAAGTGVVGDLTALDVSPHDPGPVQVAFRAGNGPALWSAYDLALPAGLVGAVAVPAR